MVWGAVGFVLMLKYDTKFGTERWKEIVMGILGGPIIWTFGLLWLYAKLSERWWG